ncbi:DUF1254 domain-containing protein [Pseudomonas sp. JUb96]|uniref:DUF1254 domain-containing protein n=1 Tax=Pseudomonas sp. JUb96 TaxID=2940539 RepID=UPI0022271C76|nr:DUF1214 domain-containing protein [Pseudomonas sp. JUb96]MCW2271758.1 hypothetical protein [Pseudomonas sp. JUb96]
MKARCLPAIALGFSLCAALAQAQTTAQSAQALSADQAREENAYTLGVQAYLWGYPLYHYAMSAPKSVKAGAVGLNTLRKYDALKTAKDRAVVTPNNVTIDAYARIEVAQEPVVVHVPALTEPRWYLTQIGNMFDEVTYNVGGIKGPAPGDYLVTGPDYRGSVPNEMTQVPLRTTAGVVAVRIFANDERDVAAAVQAQKGFQVMPLSAYQKDGLRYQPVQQQAPEPFAGSAPESVQFFDQLGHAMQQYLPASGGDDDALLTQLRLIGLSPQNGFDWRALDESTLRGLARAVGAGEQIVAQRWRNLGETTNGWRYFLEGGRAGHDFALRAALAKHVVGAQLADQVVYPNTQVDEDGAALDGRYKYVLHFAKDQQPPTSLFWNLSMYGSDMLFVENSFGRYSIGNKTAGLKPAADGSLTVLIQKDKPQDTANWLPAPPGPFNLTLRFYGPASSVLDGTYRLPAVKRVD